MTGPRAARVLRLLLFACAAGIAPGAAEARDPGNMAECLQMTRGPLEQQCGAIFGAAGQQAERTACVEQIEPQLRAVCQQFFGDGVDFCAACTSGCTEAFPAGDGKRRECLAMCVDHPGCR